MTMPTRALALVAILSLGGCWLTGDEIQTVLDTADPGAPDIFTFSGIDPDEGPVEGGEPVTIEISPLQPTVTAWFGDDFAPVLYSSPISLTVESPSAPETGCVDVIVWSDGESAVLPLAYCYL